MGKNGTTKDKSGTSKDKKGTIRGKIPSFEPVEHVAHFDDFDITPLCESPEDPKLVDDLWSLVYPDVQTYLSEEERTYLELVGKIRLLRYVMGYKRDLKSAAQSYRDMLKWYSEDKVGEIRRRIVNENITFTTIPDNEQVSSFFPVTSHHKEDKNGNLIYIELSGSLDTAKALEYSIEKFEIWLKFYLEVRSLTSDRISREQKRLIRTLMIKDLKGFGLQHAQKSILEYVKLIARVAALNYPEFMLKTVLLNVPSIFYISWKIISPWLNQHIIDKFEFFGSSGYQERIAELCPLESIPTWMGGFCKCEGGCVANMKLDTSGKTKITIGNASDYKVSVPLEEGTVKWNFNIQSHDLLFSSKFVTQSGNEIVIKAPDYAYSKDQHEGRFEIKEKGTLHLTWDNSYSRFRTKVMEYQVEFIQDTSPSTSN